MKKQMLRLTFLVATIAVIFTACQKDSIDTSEAELLQNIEESSKLITYDQAQVIEGQYIIVFKDDAVANDRASITKNNYSAKKEEMKAFANGLFNERNVASREIPHAYVKTIKGVSMKLTNQEVQSLRKDKRIAYIEQDQMFHVTMGGPPGGGGGGDPAQTTPYGVTRVGGAIDGSGAGKAWIIDSGIDLDHADLNVDLANSISFLSGGGGSSSPDDQNGHGTHVAGTVGAIDNTIGAIGVAAGAEVVAVRVLDRRGSGSNSGVIAGVDYVAANASSGDAANMSLGGGVSTALDNAVIAASSSCPFALAAGNESQDANNSSPARANGSNIYTVSSMTSSDTWSSFSNYGNPPVDYCAPGSGVYSTYKGGGYATLSGTSMASPHVCGILLIGGITTDGNVIGDPDEDANGLGDPIAHH